MANSTIQLVAQNRPTPEEYPVVESASAGTDVLTRLRSRFATPQPTEGSESRIGATSLHVTFLSRAVVLQAIGAALLAGLWIAGLAEKPFEGNNGPLCWIIVGMGLLGLGCVFLQRWNDVQWLATHIVRIGLLGTVVGLIIAFSAAGQGGSANPEEIKPMIAAVVSGMYVSLYATLLGIGTNLWLKINLRLLGNFHG
jgi:hypothetical protein